LLLLIQLVHLHARRGVLVEPGVLVAEELPHQQQMALEEMAAFEQEEQPQQMVEQGEPVELCQEERGEGEHLEQRLVF
jgi:hypothetical protein